MNIPEAIDALTFLLNHLDDLTLDQLKTIQDLAAQLLGEAEYRIKVAQK